MRNNSVIVVGAGAAGCMAAVTAAQRGFDVTLFDKNEKIGRKLLITGKGRCNVTNNCDRDTLIRSVPVNARFLYSAFSAFSPQDTMDFFERAGVPLKTERGRRVFPQSDRSTDIIDAFFRRLRELHVRIVSESVTELILEDGSVKGVKTQRGEYPAQSVIIATGGCSYPQTGSDGFGYKLAQSAGHTIVPPLPSLIPIVTKETWCAELQGLSLRNVTLTLKNEKNKTLYSELGEMLFTHYGVTGPLVLSASAHIDLRRGGEYSLTIDLKPALTEEQLDARVLRDIEENLNKDFVNSLDALLPKKLIPVAVSLSGIDPHKKCNELTKQERRAFVSLLKHITLTFGGFRPIEEAIVTCGGVKVKEIDPKTMQSKLAANLYFAGEIIDVNAYTGGFNLQIAFSTGYLAASSLPKCGE